MEDVQSPEAILEAGGSPEAERDKILDKLEEKIDFLIQSPALTEDQLHHHCLTARAAGIGSVVVRPCDVDSALRFLSLGVIQVASVVGHPFGSNSSAVKQYECRDLLRRGVRIIHAYPNPGKMHSRQFQYQEVELIQIADACIEAGAIMKVVIDIPLLNDEMKIILCRMAKRVNAHFAITTHPRDLALILKHCGGRVDVECGGVETREQAREALALGCKRIATRNPEPLLVVPQPGASGTAS